MIIEYLRKLADYFGYYTRNTNSTSEDRYTRRGPEYQARRDSRNGVRIDTSSLVSPITLSTILMAGNTDSRRRAQSKRERIRPDPYTVTTGEQSEPRRARSGRGRRSK